MLVHGCVVVASDYVEHVFSNLIFIRLLAKVYLNKSEVRHFLGGTL